MLTTGCFVLLKCAQDWLCTVKPLEDPQAACSSEQDGDEGVLMDAAAYARQTNSNRVGSNLL